MRLKIVHPGVYQIDCRDCQKFVYDLETGEKSYDEEAEEYLERGDQPPCSSCPKKKIDLDGKLKLHAKNEQLYQLYKLIKIVGGTHVPKHLIGCDVFNERIVLIDEVVAAAEAEHKALVIRRSREES